MATTREERKTLEEAGQIIRRELAVGEKVRVRGFGEFRLSRITANKGGPTGNGVKVRVNAVRFRAWGKLKNAVRQEEVVPEDKISLAPNRTFDDSNGNVTSPSGKINW